MVKISPDPVTLLTKCIDAERSKISIKIEAFDIELKPETTEKHLQTNDSELLGRIHTEIQAKNEPETKEKEISAVEPKIVKVEQEIDAIEPKIIKVEQEIDAIEPKIIKVEQEIDAIEPKIIKVEQEIDAIEPKIIKVEQEIDAVEPKIEKVEQEIDAVEPKIIKLDQEIDAVEPKIIKVEQEISAVEPKLIRVEQEISAVEPKIIRVEQEISATGPKIVKLERQTLAREEVERISKETEIEDLVESEVEENPLLKDNSDDQSYSDTGLSSLSSMEFEINKEGFSSLSDKDPKTILTWNVCGLALSKSKKNIWESFIQIVKQHDPVY
ncbi:hypothetical protein TpMuguga_03g02435 [Theileria parva strain Muguga]|uniref:uncharacterized protein n=1 Tax=Theileria parva strain Muguga TaxID=333668 RepID=UPI001C61C091|nr:uncharacterized protein TpMuguga_03g02435 [Theileria parva strain Muguga]KAF5153075.1 hypothetical protein TpMuguga_03g02435 [Theileria parva strain Muguga]